MMDFGDSELKKMLVRQGLSADRLAGRDALRMEIAGRSFYSAAPQLPHRTGEESASVYGGDLNSGKTGGAKPPASLDGWSFDPSPASRPVLELVSDRCLGTAFPTRLPRAAVSKHLVLVVCN